MPVRKAKEEDISEILDIYDRAREYMRQTGNPSQWGKIYPPQSLIKTDIDNGNLFVLEDGSKIYGVFAFFPLGDDVYDHIEGAWLNSYPHAAIHRVASSGERRGVLAECVEYCLATSSNLKIDTHTDNRIMQSGLKKLGFRECGKIFLPQGEERIAFQLYNEAGSLKHGEI